ncbi:hypothetical protein AKJ48_01095 [candidate division MSBL1 archaeon SCGC-AAA261O19]|uniref:4Fe-4S ferredoxin-type domain-containing protein n=1 Tax=candidate division MSBL1 archaeon SCGC-AAA261O19 TaxID=1698277 RepID=A0A133VEJ4_9EURY|nr:hypothetical protein AKJ48_01095 [candidate division MSBL1 archaeon SCGC-AAA261O19]
MPNVIYDYGKCNGNASCAEVCPVNILEESENGRWCKPIDEKVENEEAVKQFHEEVEESETQLDVTIENDMPECIQCMACVASCPEDAIQIE